MTYDQLDFIKILINLVIVGIAIPIVLYFFKRSMRKVDVSIEENITLHRRIIAEKTDDIKKEVELILEKLGSVEEKNSSSHKELRQEINLVRERIVRIETILESPRQ